MERRTQPPRPDWERTVEAQGLIYHSHPEGPYWDESVCYAFADAEIDELEKATYELNRITLAAVEHILEENRLEELEIPPRFHEFIARSWERDEFTVYGRFDLCYDGRRPPKLLEFNADTPTALLEAAVIQWHWLQDTHPHAGQFNSLHEKLIEAWRAVRRERESGGTLTFAALASEAEDFMTATYLRDTALQAGWQTQFLDMADIGWHPGRLEFTDLAEQPIFNCFKLYPWEWLFREAFAEHLPLAAARWLEPPWKAILSNKALLVILWELFPNHPNLLPAWWEPPAGGDYVEKPIHGREGANVVLFRDGRRVAGNDGPYDGPCIWQEARELPVFDGRFRPCLGTWTVNGWAAGLGIREDVAPITGNRSRFVPHLIDESAASR